MGSIFVYDPRHTQVNDLAEHERRANRFLLRGTGRTTEVLHWKLVGRHVNDLDGGRLHPQSAGEVGNCLGDDFSPFERREGSRGRR